MKGLIHWNSRSAVALANGRRKLRIGWVVGDQLSHLPFMRQAVLGGGGIGRARFLWVADYVNKHSEWDMRYEVYRPWKAYDAVVFLKAMGPSAEKLAGRLQEKGTAVVFDANVNHYDVRGRSYYANMLPTREQQNEAMAMTRMSDAVIADSVYLQEKIKPLNKRVTWIPDCVEMSAVPGYVPWNFATGKLPLLWSGQSLKLFELLAIEDVLRAYRSHIELILITNATLDTRRWFDSTRQSMDRLLGDVPHRFIDFRSIEQLLSVYAGGGIVVAPRFLDNTYNYGHTEWKITLGMACGRFAVCDPVPSYVKVGERANGIGVRICRSSGDWEETLDALLSRELDLAAEGRSARRTVDEYYSTRIVAAQHSRLMRELISERPAGPTALERGSGGAS